MIHTLQRSARKPKVYHPQDRKRTTTIIILKKTNNVIFKLSAGAEPVRFFFVLVVLDPRQYI